MDDLFNRIVYIFDFEHKSAQEIVEIFDCLLEIIFADNIFNSDRFLVVEKFASFIVERSPHIILLSAALKYRIHRLRAKSFQCHSIND